MMGPIHRDLDGKKRFLIVWSGPREPDLPAILDTSLYIAYASQWDMSDFESDIDNS
jgi:hypothetical protein